jgi:hypothetical protein
MKQLALHWKKEDTDSDEKPAVKKIIGADTSALRAMKNWAVQGFDSEGHLGWYSMMQSEDEARELFSKIEKGLLVKNLYGAWSTASQTSVDVVEEK